MIKNTVFGVRGIPKERWEFLKKEGVRGAELNQGVRRMGVLTFGDPLPNNVDIDTLITEVGQSVNAGRMLGNMESVYNTEKRKDSVIFWNYCWNESKKYMKQHGKTPPQKLKIGQLNLG